MRITIPKLKLVNSSGSLLIWHFLDSIPFFCDKHLLCQYLLDLRKRRLLLLIATKLAFVLLPVNSNLWKNFQDRSTCLTTNRRQRLLNLQIEFSALNVCKIYNFLVSSSICSQHVQVFQTSIVSISNWLN